MRYNISDRCNILLMLLLILLNLVIRIPSIPHEKGYDSFYIHSLANSISYFGEAKWWIDWTSIFGLFPYSYASAVPFMLSGLSQLTEIRVELIILLYCIFLGIFSIFSSYLFATIFFENFMPRFLFSFIFSLSASTVGLTTWEITTRSQFLVFFPFFLYFVFKLLHLQMKFLILLGLTFVLLLATHHYIYIALFFSILMLIVAIINRYKQGIKLKFDFNINYIYILILIALFAAPFFGFGGFIKAGSRYTWIIDLILISIRSSGFIFPLAISGATYLILKDQKRLEEWAILICLLPTVIFSYNKVYGYLISYLLLTFFGAIGIFNIAKNYNNKTNKIILGVLVLFLISNIMFSSFFAHWRLGMMGGASEWYMREDTYITGEWVKEHIDENKNAMSSNRGEAIRMYASYGTRPRLYSNNINNYINGFISLNMNDTSRNSFFSKDFYFDNPIVLKSGHDSLGYISWISEFPIGSEKPRNFITRNNISYYFDDKRRYSNLAGSLPQNKNNIYNSGRMLIWEF